MKLLPDGSDIEIYNENHAPLFDQYKICVPGGDQ